MSAAPASVTLFQRCSWNHRQSKIFAGAFVNMNRPSGIFIRSYERNVPPRIWFDVFPGEQLVFPRRHSLHSETTRIVCGHNLIQIGPLTKTEIGYQNHRSIREGLLLSIDDRPFDLSRIGSDHDFEQTLGWAGKMKAVVEDIGVT